MSATTERPAGSISLVPRSSLALGNLRAFVILLVLSFHSVLAYLQFLPAAPFPFDSPPYQWRAIPIIDSHRWLGFDLYCAWQDVFLMSLFFFLSGLFVWPSLDRKGDANFLNGRLLRLGLPFALVVAILMPAALYPTYLQTASDPGLAAYWRHWLALPFWPCGPVWFLWLLLVGDFGAAACIELRRGWAICWFDSLGLPKPIRPGSLWVLSSPRYWLMCPWPSCSRHRPGSS
jgi:glucans biosynthesis protein C